MKEKVLFIIVEQYADWEYAFLASALQGSIKDKTSPYEVKTVSLCKNPVKSIGGFTTLPDYGIDDMPTDYAALILIGGTSWRTEEAKKFTPIVRTAYENNKIVGAICDATVFLGMCGLLNEKMHTSNTLESLIEAAGENYTGKVNYQNIQAVRDGNLITANGTAYLELCKEVLTGLNAYPVDYIEENYQFFDIGFIEMMKIVGASKNAD